MQKAYVNGFQSVLCSVVDLTTATMLDMFPRSEFPWKFGVPPPEILALPPVDSISSWILDTRILRAVMTQPAPRSGITRQKKLCESGPVR